SFNGKIGRSDLKLDGSITNYIDYIFKENALLKGKMNLNSNVLDINEWMTDESDTEETGEGDTTEMEVVVIPRNIDFEFNSSIKNIYYDNLNLQNARGLLTVRGGVLDMSNLSFNLLGGSIVMNGTYDTRQPEKPMFDYNLKIKSLSIPQAFTSFSTVQTFAPMAKYMNGEFSTNFDIRGLLNNDLSPVYESLNGKGLIQIAEAHMKESKLVSGIAGFMKTDATSSQLKLKDVIMKTSLKNGRAYVDPFDVNLAGQTANLSGSIGADGSLDYRVSTEVEAGVVGQQVNQLLAGLRGQDASAVSSKIKLNFTVGGTYENPKIVLAGTTTEDGTTTTVTEQMNQEVKQEVDKQVEEVKKEAEEQIMDETEKLMEKGEEQLQEHVDTLKKKITENLKDDAGEILGEELDSTANELKKSLQNLFKKKKKN
ncbi:MAG: AsmA-like C-terminal region-containing protein, partial [Cyclobacteriaceae bacterium]|nr:AsmA-like C-terminal region-containing protein [Cyclobacteriaceae bacterium]